MSTKPDAHHFLSALFDDSDLIELRVIDPGTGEVKERRFEKGPEAAAGIINWLRDHPWYKGCNIYYACAARRTRRGGSKTNLSRVRALWADCDGTAPDDVLLHLLLEGPEIHQPSIVVASGGGAHLYWLLDEPLDVSVPGNIERLEAILKGLARAIPADPAATDASRVLRPPDTINYPSAKKRAVGRVEAPVRLVELRPDRRFSLDDFAAFEAIGRERAPGAKVDVVGATWPMWDGAGEDELPDSVRAALRQHDILSRYFRREAIESEDQSTIDYALACAGARCGLDAEAIYQLVKASRTIFVGDEKAAHRDDYFRRTALKAHTEHANKHAESMARFAAEPQPLVPPKSPRRINLSNRQRDDLASDVAAAVVAWNDPPMLFRRGGAVVRAYAGARGEIELREQDAARFLDVTAPVAIYTENRNTSDGWKVVNAKLSAQEAGVVLERLTVGDLLPPLRGIVHHPVLRSDGAIVSRPGYDAASGLYLDPLGPPLVLSVADRPTPSDASVAAEALLEVVAEFPFVSPAHKTNALAALITPPLRELIEGPVPLFANDAPAAGSGKSLLVRVASVLSRGRVAPALPEPGREDEWRKRILALLIAGADIVFIDNVEKPLQSASLAGVLTSTDWSDRVLGVSTMATSLPHRATWYTTGNNLDIRGDLVRRTVWIRIDPQLARPDERDKFTHPDLLEWTRRERGRLLSAAFTLGRAWLVAGRPDADAPEFGSFEGWRRTVGGALRLAGIKDFLGNRAEMFEALHESNRAWGPFLAACLEKLGPAPFTAKELTRRLDESQELRDLLPDDDEKLANSGDPAFPRALGMALRSRRDQRHPLPSRGVVWVESAGVSAGVGKYRVRRG